MDPPEPSLVSSHSELATLLAAAYRDVETLRNHVAALQKRADKGDRLAEVLSALGSAVSPDASPSPQGPPSASVPATNGSANPASGDTPSTPAPAVSALSLSPQIAQQLRHVVEMYEEKLAHVQGLLEESEARNKESWRQLDEILLSLQSQVRGARAIVRPHADSPSGHPNPGPYMLGYTYTDSPTSAAFPSASPGAMGPPAPHGHGVSSSRHAHSGSGGSGAGSGSRVALASTAPVPGAPVAFALPPHPPLPHSASAASPSPSSHPHSHPSFHQAATPQQLHQQQPGVAAGPTRRPRTPSMDNLYALAQPPSKRSRPGGAPGVYDSYPPTTTGSQHQRPLGPSSTVPASGSTFSDPQQSSQQQSHVQARIIDRKYRSPNSASTGYVAHPLSQSHSHSQAYGTHISGSGAVRGGRGDRERDRERGGGRSSAGNGAEVGLGHPHTHGQGQGHSRSASHSSASSMDVDDMIIKASTEGDVGDVNGTQAGMSGGTTTAAATRAGWGREGSHLANAHAHSFLIGGPAQPLTQSQSQGGYAVPVASSSHHHRRRSDRERDRDSPGGAGGYAAGGQSQSQSFTGVSARVSGPAPSSNPMSGEREREGVREGRSYTTVFAPVVTGAPTKKSKYPNSNSVVGSSASLDTLAAPSSSLSGIDSSSRQQHQLQNQNSQNVQQQQQLQQNQPPPAKPYPATNEKGERICRTCGIVGRYKDGKCVEKWGPGIMGPGTVCDRCRKKAKRDEGRKEQQQQQQQQQQLQPRSNSHAQLPLSQGSDRSIQRSDTILTTHHQHQPSTHSFIQSTPGSATFVSGSNARGGGATARHAPTPPKIASLREKADDDDEDDGEDDDGEDGDRNVNVNGPADGRKINMAVARERDPEQLPMSNVGRGVAAVIAASSKNNSRSNSRNRRVPPGSAKPAPPPPSAVSAGAGAPPVTGKKGSISPGSVMVVDDEIDADADADAEAEAEAEILGAVEAAAAHGDDSGDYADGDGDGEGDLENDADADAELLEAVDAAEANSMESPHGGDRPSWLKSEPI